MTRTTETTSIRKLREATVKEHIDAENRHDPDATVATFSSAKASYDIPAFGDAGQVPDHAAIRELFVGMYSVFPDFHIVPGPCVMVTTTYSLRSACPALSTPTGSGIPVTGRSFDPRGRLV